jgi:hypothetical protein
MPERFSRAKIGRIGGSFAPPLTDELLDRYEALATAAGGPVGDGMLTCLRCCRKWWDLPESTGDGRPHPSGRGVIVDLDAALAEQLDEHIPWEHEIEALRGLFDGLDPAGKELRNAAFHLLWHVIELNNDREPLTADKIKVTDPVELALRAERASLATVSE